MSLEIILALFFALATTLTHNSYTQMLFPPFPGRLDGVHEDEQALVVPPTIPLCIYINPEEIWRSGDDWASGTPRPSLIILDNQIIQHPIVATGGALILQGNDKGEILGSYPTFIMYCIHQKMDVGTHHVFMLLFASDGTPYQNVWTFEVR